MHSFFQEFQMLWWIQFVIEDLAIMRSMNHLSHSQKCIRYPFYENEIQSVCVRERDVLYNYKSDKMTTESKEHILFRGEGKKLCLKVADERPNNIAIMISRHILSGQKNRGLKLKLERDLLAKWNSHAGIINNSEKYF